MQRKKALVIMQGFSFGRFFFDCCRLPAIKIPLMRDRFSEPFG